MVFVTGGETTPPRACVRGGGWFRFGGFDAVESVVTGESPGAEHRGEAWVVLSQVWRSAFVSLPYFSILFDQLGGGEVPQMKHSFQSW